MIDEGGWKGLQHNEKGWQMRTGAFGQCTRSLVRCIFTRGLVGCASMVGGQRD